MGDLTGVNMDLVVAQLFANLQEFIASQEGVSFAERVLPDEDIAALAGLSLEFARTKLAGNTKQKKKCSKGFACGFTCIAAKRNCKNPLDGQSKTYADYLAKQAMANKPKKITESDARAEPWKYSASHYQAAIGVKQPWIAEVSPMQMGLMSKRQKAEYQKKRSEEWDASAKAKQEWADKIWQAYKSGKITEKDLTGGSSGLFEMSARDVVTSRKIAEDQVKKQQIIKQAQEKNKIQSVQDVEVGDRVYDMIYRSYGTVVKKNQKSLRVMDEKGDEYNLDIGMRTQWRSLKDLEPIALNGEEVRPPKPDFSKVQQEVKAKKQAQAKIKVSDIKGSDFYGKSLGDKTDLWKNASSAMKDAGLRGITLSRLGDAKNAIAKLPNPENYEIIRIPQSFGRTEYSIIKKVQG